MTQGPEEYVHVTTKYGKITGRHVFLCDTPGTAERERPVITYPSPSAHRFPPPNPQAFNPVPHRARVRSNVTIFLGIPYAKAPTKENALRFKAPRDPDHFGSLEAITYGPSCPQPMGKPTPVNVSPGVSSSQRGNQPFPNPSFVNPINERERITAYQKVVGGNKWNIERIHEDCLYLNVFSPYVSVRVGSVREFFGNFLGIFWEHFRNILGIFWEFSQNQTNATFFPSLGVGTSSFTRIPSFGSHSWR